MDATGRFMPGEGAYYLVASRAGMAGVVSPRLIVREVGVHWKETWREDDWSRGRTIELRKDVTELTLRFEEAH